MSLTDGIVCLHGLGVEAYCHGLSADTQKDEIQIEYNSIGLDMVVRRRRASWPGLSGLRHAPQTRRMLSWECSRLEMP